MKGANHAVRYFTFLSGKKSGLKEKTFHCQKDAMRVEKLEEIKERIAEMLTKSEKQVMKLLWSIDRPLSCTEITELSGDKTWKDSYVHSLINSLMKKGLVKIESFELISRSYARKFAPKLSKPEYIVREIQKNTSPDELYEVTMLLNKQL